MLSISKVEIADLDKLISFSRKTFLDSFSHLNSPEDIALYSKKAFDNSKMLAELNNPNSAFYCALWDDELAGYIKINFAGAQTDLNDATTLELERIYVSVDHQGKRIGKELLNFAISIARKDNLKQLWLGVWEHNHKAITFYEKNGLEPFGSHDFMLGNDKQTDILMRKSIL
ncbi:GNAT family N-acetyltransferase [Mucilaginibacter sp.]